MEPCPVYEGPIALGLTATPEVTFPMEWFDSNRENSIRLLGETHIFDAKGTWKTKPGGQSGRTGNATPPRG